MSALNKGKKVCDCLKDILNFFNRQSEDYVVSAPVWEYFSNENYNREQINKEMSAGEIVLLYYNARKCAHAV